MKNLRWFRSYGPFVAAMSLITVFFVFQNATCGNAVRNDIEDQTRNAASTPTPAPSETFDVSPRSISVQPGKTVNFVVLSTRNDEFDYVIQGSVTGNRRNGRVIELTMSQNLGTGATLVITNRRTQQVITASVIVENQGGQNSGDQTASGLIFFESPFRKVRPNHAMPIRFRVAEDVKSVDVYKGNESNPVYTCSNPTPPSQTNTGSTVNIYSDSAFNPPASFYTVQGIQIRPNTQVNIQETVTTGFQIAYFPACASLNVIGASTQTTTQYRFQATLKNGSKVSETFQVQTVSPGIQSVQTTTLHTDHFVGFSYFSPQWEDANGVPKMRFFAVNVNGTPCLGSNSPCFKDILFTGYDPLMYGDFYAQVDLLPGGGRGTDKGLMEVCIPKEAPHIMYYSDRGGSGGADFYWSTPRSAVDVFDTLFVRAGGFTADSGGGAGSASITVKSAGYYSSNDSSKQCQGFRSRYNGNPRILEVGY